MKIRGLAFLAGFDLCPKNETINHMKALILFIAWCILLVLCWPLALLVLLLFPVIWLLSIPFRLIGITFDAVFALLRTILFLPARLLGWRRRLRRCTKRE